MGLLEKIRRALKEPIDTFHCYHCGKKYPGKWCPACTDKNPRGTYYDERGYPCKPTGVLPPNTERVKRMYQKTVRSTAAVYEAMKALDALDKQYTITKKMAADEPPFEGTRSHPEWTITEVAEQTGEMASLHAGEYIIPADNKTSDAGGITINVNMVSNIKDFSEEFTKEFEKVIEQIETMLSRPLSDYVSVEISTDDAQQT